MITGLLWTVLGVVLTISGVFRFHLGAVVWGWIITAIGIVVFITSLVGPP